MNIHLPIASLNTLYPVCACTKQVYLHLYLLHCHLHITMCHHMWTMCEHASTNCFLKLIATCMSRDKVNVCTCTCNILLLASEHVQHVWMCAHPCSTLWFLYDHVTTCVKVWTMLSSVSLWRCITCSSWWELEQMAQFRIMYTRKLEIRRSLKEVHIYIDLLLVRSNKWNMHACPERTV